MGVAASMNMRRQDVVGSSFVERHDLWGPAQFDAARKISEQIREAGVETVRFAFPDQHGVLRGKTIVAAHVEKALRTGVMVPTSLIAKDTAHKTVFPLFTPGGGFGMKEMQGASDMFMIADPATFKVIPWASNSGWVLCDPYFGDGRPVPLASRGILMRALRALADFGFDFVVGLEVEFHVFRLLDPALRLDDAGQPGRPPEVGLLSQGYQYLTEIRFDQIEPVVEVLRKNVAALQLPLRSLELEYGPSQLEVTFVPMDGLAAADAMMLFRSAVKQICRRQGYHATFMCRPRIPGVMSSGWHLHQSLRQRSDASNAFAGDGEELSPIGRHYLAGLLAHARGTTAMAAPTVNGYRRYRPYSLAPDRVSWGEDNRGALVRVIASRDASETRIENRIGEPAANPYLYFSSQMFAGLDGIQHKMTPPAPVSAPYEVHADGLPSTLSEALKCLRDDSCLCTGFGQAFIDYFCKIKEAEIARFNQEVTDWEHREYFEIF